MRTKDGHDLPVEKITADNYIVPKGEERFFHVKIEVKQFNPKTGAKISTPAIQIFGPKTYRTIMAKQLKRLGYAIEVLHDPDEWMKANAAKAAALRAEQARAAQAAAESKKAAELAAIKEQTKAELLAELRAAGVIPAAEQAPTPETHKGPGRPAKQDKE